MSFYISSQNYKNVFGYPETQKIQADLNKTKQLVKENLFETG